MKRTQHIFRGWLPIAAASFLALSSCGGGGEGSKGYYVGGSGKLADCDEAPVMDLDDTEWFDTGTLTILSDGCSGVEMGETLNVCALNWKFSQTDNSVEIVVDNEYQIHGRLCDEELTLQGGWWLPVEDDGACTYAEDSAEEVGIEAEGNALTVNPDDGTMTGTLVVRGPCKARYEVVFYQLR